MGRPQGSKNKSSLELIEDTNIVAPKIPSKNTQEEEEKHPLDDIEHVRLENIGIPTDRDKELIMRLSTHQLTELEICAVLDISRSAYDASLVMQAAYQRGQQMGKASLRRMQWRTAPKSAIMQIWLGKQVLGQTDKLETTRDDGSKDAARQAFEDKLKSIIDVTPTGSAHADVNPGGSGGRELLLETVGEGQPNRTDERPVVEPRLYPAIS